MFNSLHVTSNNLHEYFLFLLEPTKIDAETVGTHTCLFVHSLSGKNDPNGTTPTHKVFEILPTRVRVQMGQLANTIEHGSHW